MRAMKKYIVTVKEVHSQFISVEAENEEAAKMIAYENVIFSSYDEAEVSEIKKRRKQL